MIKAQGWGSCPCLGLLSGAGDGNRTRTVSLGIKPIRTVIAADLASARTASDRCCPLITLANCTLIARPPAGLTCTEPAVSTRSTHGPLAAAARGGSQRVAPHCPDPVILNGDIPYDPLPRQPPRRDSFIAALLDVKFERRVTPILVRWLYVLALVVIGFGTLFGLL